MDLKNVKFPLVRIKKQGTIEIREVQHADGTFEHIFREKNKLLPKVVLSGHLIEQVRSMQLIDKDLRNVLSWIELTDEIYNGMNMLNNFHEPDLAKNSLIKSLFVSVVTFYGKCFTEAKGRKFSLNKTNIPSEHKILHEKIMNLRHNFAAHKGDFYADDCKLALVIYGSKKEMQYEVFSCMVQANNFFESKEFLELSILCKLLQKYVNDKREKIIEKMYIDKISPKGFDYWISKNGKIVKIH